MTVGCLVSGAAERLPAPFTSSVLPVILRPAERPAVKSARRRVRQDRPTFELKSVVASNDDVVEFAPPVKSNEQRGGLYDDVAGTASVDDQVNLPDPEEGAIPFSVPSPALPPPLETMPRQPRDRSVPLDAFFREDHTEDGDEENADPSLAKTRDSLGWIAGSQNQLGMLELDLQSLSHVYYHVPDKVGSCEFNLGPSFGARWLTGPNSPDLPPYLFNVLIDVGAAFRLSERFAVDWMISPGWYTDFSNKGIDAFRLPWHVATFNRINDSWEWVLGITDLSREDIRLLPIFGFVYAPPSGDVRLDLVFPKPKAAWRIYEREECKLANFKIERHEGWLYVSGELGGGSWAISRSDRQYDVVTYRDYRLFAGWESRQQSGHSSRIEVGWIFGRAVEYQSNNGNYNPPDSVMVRYSADY